MTNISFVAKYEISGRISGFCWKPKDLDRVAALRATFEAAGVIFTDGDSAGVKLRKAEE